MDTRSRSSLRTRSNSLIQTGNNAQQTNNGIGTTRTRHKSGNASYADLITRAIMNSDEKKLTLSEIYDWMVDNVPGLKDQRYLHSAKGWKNAVRHTLSINPRFRKMARLGRPGWWTVDPEFMTRNIGVIAPASSFTAATLLMDGPQQQPGFRGRLSSAPALFLSPIFAASASSPANGCLSSHVTSAQSRPPSSASVRSSGGASSTPISPNSEIGFSVLSPPRVANSPLDNGTQTVQVYREGGVGLLAVPRPLQVRLASVQETATQTEEPPINQYFADDRRISSIPRYRSCNYLENVSAAPSPLSAIGSSPISIDRSLSTEQISIDQLCSHSPVKDQLRVSLGRCENGQPIIILTSTKISDTSTSAPAPQIISDHLASITDNNHLISIIDQNRSSDHTSDQASQVIGCPKLQQLPDDLEGIDIDPNVQCDVTAVIKYEQTLRQGSKPKLEPISEQI